MPYILGTPIVRFRSTISIFCQVIPDCMRSELLGTDSMPSYSGQFVAPLYGPNGDFTTSSHQFVGHDYSIETVKTVYVESANRPQARVFNKEFSQFRQLVTFLLGVFLVKSARLLQWLVFFRQTKELTLYVALFVHYALLPKVLST